MSRFERREIISLLYGVKAVPLFFSPDEKKSCGIVSACFAGGFKAVEFTDRGDGAVEVFSSVIKHVKASHHSCALGAGSITDAYSASQYLSAGADFIVGPSFCVETAKLCNRRKVVYIPGCSSVNEIMNAMDYGVEFIKIFPGDVLTPKFIKAVKGPLPQVSFMVAGGVSPDERSLAEWFSSGASCVALGGQFITKNILDSENYCKLKEDSEALLQILSRI